MSKKCEPAPLEAALRARIERWLARREHSRAELTSRLSRLGFDPALIGAVLDQAEAAGWLSDRRYAAVRTRSLQARGRGPLAIRAALSKAGLGRAEVDRAVGELSADWEAQARACLVARFGVQEPLDAREWARRARYLATRGFPEALIRRVLSRAPDERP
jgi:regulatory protein